MKASIKLYILPLLLGATFFIFFIYYARLDMKRTCGESEMQIETSTKLLASVLVGNIQHLIKCNHGCVSTARLDELVSVMMATTDLEFFRIKQDDHALISFPSDSDVGKRTHFEGETGTIRENGYLYHWRTLRLAFPPKEESSHDHLKGQTDIVAMNGSHIKLIVGYPFVDCLTAHQLSKQKFIIRVAIAGILVVVFMFSVVYAVRNQKLKREVAVLQQKNENLEVLNLAATGLAHETKNPLGIIRGIAQRLCMSVAIDETVKESAQAIVEQADITVDRLGDFMNYARLTSPTLIEVNLRDVCSDIIQVFSFDCDDKKINLSVDIDDKMVLADHKVLEHILSNLFLNSIRACSEGDSISLATSCDSSGVIMRVEDSGKGISQHLLPDIFKPYVSGSSDGHGIGLSIVKRCIEESGWKIDVLSTEGKGTVMTISCIQEVK